MSEINSDARRATDAAIKLREIAIRLENTPAKNDTKVAQTGLRAAADLFDECLIPPLAPATDALLEIIVIGVRHILSSAK